MIYNSLKQYNYIVAILQQFILILPYDLLRNEVSPSVEIARKIADILDVSLDYLTSKVDVEMDKDIQKLILEVSKFEDEDRKNIFSVIEAFVAKRKIQSIM